MIFSAWYLFQQHTECQSLYTLKCHEAKINKSNILYETYQIFVPSYGEYHLHLALLRTALHVGNIVKSDQVFLFPNVVY